MTAVPGEVEDPTALVASEVEFPGAGGDAVRGYLVQPRAGASWPGLVVVHEAMGLNEHIRDVARRFANVGYQALAPDLYSREGPPGADMESIVAAMQAIPDDRAVGDLEGAVAFLRRLPGATARVGCVGFCSGGRHTLLFACRSDSVDAAVDCWGGNILRASADRRTTPQRPVAVVDLAGRLSCPTLLVAGAEDANPSPDDVRAFATAARQPVEVEVYDDAGHAFFADYRPTYRAEAAARLWPRMLEFLGRHLH